MLKVLIRRKFKPGKEQEVRVLLNQMRSDAMNVEGYISAETYFGHDNPNQMLVISTWQLLKIGDLGDSVHPEQNPKNKKTGS